MGQKEEYKFAEEASPDESWWSAVMADVEAHSGTARGTPDDSEELSAPDIDWKWAENLYSQDEIIELHVTGHNRGGLLVEDQRIKGFVPLSHLIEISEETNEENIKEILTAYIGRTLQLKVIECNPKRERVVLSERAAQAAPGQRLELLKRLTSGAHITGRVTTITDFGVFVDLGGVEGLIHISELSWGRVTHPNEVLSPGEEIEVCVLSLDQERCRVALSLKRLLPNPWDTAHLNYQPGQVAEATITNIVPYGAFARLQEGLDGLIHISEIQGNHESPEEVLIEGQRVQVTILHIDPSRQQLGLRLKTEKSEL